MGMLDEYLWRDYLDRDAEEHEQKQYYKEVEKPTSKRIDENATFKRVLENYKNILTDKEIEYICKKKGIKID